MSKSMIVGGMGLAMSIITNLVKEVKKRGGSDEDIHRLSTPDGENLLERIAEILVSPNRSVYNVVVDYNRSLAEMIEVGKYNWVNDSITTNNFPVQGEGKQEKEIVLFYFNKTMTSEQVISEMEKENYQPGRIEHLLAFGENQSDLQRQFPIVALDFVWRSPEDGRRYVLELYEVACGRHLSLSWFGRAWIPCRRFIGVRK